VYGYQYTGVGGLSWSIPYAAGVLALGWQVNPRLSPDRAVELLRQTAYDKEGFKVINPVAFVAAVRATVVAAQ
jgi:serine protease AprX